MQAYCVPLLPVATFLFVEASWFSHLSVIIYSISPWGLARRKGLFGILVSRDRENVVSCQGRAHRTKLSLFAKK
jgi:hypothetical protein